MKFLQQAMNYLLNRALTEGLANNRTFQRFAITTDKMLKEVAKEAPKSAEELKRKATEYSRQFSEEFTKALKEEQGKGKNKFF